MPLGDIGQPVPQARQFELRGYATSALVIGLQKVFSPARVRADDRAVARAYKVERVIAGRYAVGRKPDRRDQQEAERACSAAFQKITFRANWISRELNVDRIRPTLGLP